MGNRSMIRRYHWLVQQRGRREAVVREGCKNKAECMYPYELKETQEQREKVSKLLKINCKHAF